jgi:hypothetical protein
MALSRRRFLSSAAVTAGAAALSAAQTRPKGPFLCLYSQLLPDVEYPDLGPILSGMGFDGCDLSVQPGGTVEPTQISVDLVRAIETLEGRNVEVPLITTAYVSPEVWARNVLYISGGSGVPLFRGGYWKFPGAQLAALKGQIAGLAAVGRAYKMAMGVPQTAGEEVLRDLDPAWVGYDFDPSQTGGITLEAALPRLKMVKLRDARRQNGAVTPCPLGEGDVDWEKFFDALARVRFSGPLTLQSDYPAPERVAAIRKDLDFARQHLTSAYKKALEPTSRPPSNAR